MKTLPIYAPRACRMRTVAVFAVALAAALLLGSTAMAQDKKPGTGASGPIKTFKAQEPEKKASDVKTDVPSGPSAGRDAFEVGGRDPKEIERLQKKIRSLNEKQIARIDKILSKDKGHRRRADMLFEKAELKYEVLKYDELFAKAKWIKCLEAESEGNVAEGSCKEPVQDYSPALEVYKTVLQEFPSYARLDEVIYRLGDGLMKAGKKKEAISFLTRLVQNYPKSKYVPDSYLTIADFWFDQKLLVAASDSYKEVLKHPQSNLFYYAKYKLAWVYYNQQEYREAINTFKDVIAQAEQPGTPITFAKQAMNDIVVSWVEVDDGWREAKDYFKGKADDKYVSKKMRQFAALYAKDGKNEPRIEVLEYLLTAEPTSTKAPDYWEGIIEARKNIAADQAYDDAIRRMIGYFDPKGKWWGANQGNKKATNNARLMAEGYLAQLASEAHQQAQKDNDPKLYARAAKDYGLFLEKFPDSENAYDIRFYYAEILYGELKKFEQAADQYKQVHAEKADGEYAKDSLFAVIKSYEALVLKEHKKSVLVRLSSDDEESRMEAVNTKDKIKAAQKKERSDLFKWETPFVEASDTWAKVYPKDANTPTIMFVAAEIFRDHGQYDKAVGRYEHIIKFAPKHRYASFAGNSLLECNNELGKWSEIERWGRYLLENKIFDVTPKDKLQSAIAYAISKKADDLQKEKRFNEAAEEMLRLADEWPKSDLAPTAIFNAAAIYERGDQIKKAVANYERLIKTFPDNERAPEALFVMGAIFEARTDFERAAGFFERLGTKKEWRTNERAKDAIYNAAYIRESLEQWDKSIATYENYIKLYAKDKKDDSVAELAFHIGELYEKAGDKKKAEKVFSDVIRKYKNRKDLHVHAYLKLGKLTQAKGSSRKNDKAADGYFTKTVQTWGKLEDEKKKLKTKQFAAEARFLQGEEFYKQSRDVQLEFPDHVLAKRAQERGGLVEKAQTIYFEAIEMEDPFWSAAAAYRIGQMYKEFSDQLYNLPIPEGLPQEVEDIYRMSVDDLSFPLQEKALSAFQNAVKLALKLGAYNEWSAKSAFEMSRLEKESYPITKQEGVNSDHVAEIFLKSGALALEDVEERAKATDTNKKRKPDPKPSATPSQETMP